MTQIILDSNILLQFPKILGIELKDCKYIIPIEVVEELEMRTQQAGGAFDRRMNLLTTAIRLGIAEIFNNRLSDLPNGLDKTRLSIADISLIRAALDMQQDNGQVKIATDDREVVKNANARGIQTLSGADLINLIEKFESDGVSAKTNELNNEIAAYERSEIRILWRGILHGVLSSVAGYTVYSNLQLLLETITVWGTIVVTMVLGILLFVFREKQRLGYGIFEFLVGIIVIILLFIPSEFNLQEVKFNLDFNVKFLGGLYIMVRGQDNIVKSQKGKSLGFWLNNYGIGS
jgi:rRNA-processing protein FCF1